MVESTLFLKIIKMQTEFFTDYLIKQSRLEFGRIKINIRDYENNYFNFTSLNISVNVMLTHHYNKTRLN